MKVAILLSLFVVAITSVNVQLLNQCIHDGTYQCTYPAVYNWEAPPPSALFSNGNCYGVSVNLGFSTKLYGDNLGTNWDFDCDLIIRNYFAGQYSSVTAMYYGYSDSNTKRYMESKGTSPNRVVIFTFDNTIQAQSGQRISSQIKVYENGNYEVHIKSFILNSANYMYVGLEHYSGGNNYLHWPVYQINPGNYSGRAWGFYAVPPAPVQSCGNGIVEGSEQCDGGVCCTSTCNFKPSTQSCRAATGFCDIEEFCTGSTSSCPSNSFKSSAIPCNEDFGVCDVKLNRHCTGNSGVCSGLQIPTLDKATIKWLGYNVISFGNFNAESGSVGGRLAVKGNVQINGGFSVGNEVQLVTPNLAPGVTENPISYSFIGGHSVTWTDGTISPAFGSLREEYGYAGDSFTGAAGLAEKFIGSNPSGSNLDGYFDNAQAYYVAIGQELANEATNVNAVLQWGGIYFSCNDNSGRYVVNVNSNLFDSATYYSVDQTCAYGSTWVINIVGNGAVTFQGGDFPGIGERILFNVIGSGRTVNVNSRVNGNLLAPTSTVVQNGGVTQGLVIAGNIGMMLSSVVPSCTDFKPFDIVVPIQVNAPAGSNNLQVVGFNAFIAGDSFSIGSDPSVYTITGRKITADGQNIIEINPSLTAAFGENSMIKTTVANPSAMRVQDNITVEEASANGAFTVVASIVVVVAALLF